MIWWILGSVCGGLVLLTAVALVFFYFRERKNRNHVLENGEHTVGWLVQANERLFKEGAVDLPALVLISPDEKTAADEEFMTDLADQVFDLKGTDPDSHDDTDDAFVAELMSDEMYIEGKRDKLPKRFARGRKVYLAHILVFREDLPNKRIRGRKIPCAVIWDEPKSMICTRPVSRRRRRTEEDDEEE